MIEISEYAYDRLVKERDDLIKENRGFIDDHCDSLLEIKKLQLQLDELTMKCDDLKGLNKQLLDELNKISQEHCFYKKLTFGYRKLIEKYK